MHCNRKDINKWNNQAKLRKQSKDADEKRKQEPLIKAVKLDKPKIQIVKKDGTVQSIK